MNSALKNYATYVNNKIDVCEISLNQYISTDNILQNKQGIECAASLPIQGGKVTAFKKGDILLANIRPYLKKIWYAQFDGGCSADVLAIRANAKIDSHFLFYALFRDDFFIHAMKGSKGTKMPRGDKSQIMEFKIPVFDPKTQQSIAAVLSALDKKIALNKQINARLEEMAKTLYDYWFVQFDFPNTNGKPYKSSGGEMVFDETLKRKIPKGWEVKNLGDWAEIRKGTLITEKTANTNGDIKVISAGVDFSYYHDVANRPRNTITISASGANAGFVNFWREPIFACDCTTITNRVIGSTLYILNFLKIVQDFIYQQARGSAQPHVYPKDIEGLKIIVPPDLLLKRFSEFVENWNLKIANNEKQNHHLTQLRDFLLPMLMNGQVSVAE